MNQTARDVIHVALERAERDLTVLNEDIAEMTGRLAELTAQRNVLKAKYEAMREALGV